jgi:hypothetical protein
MEGHLLLDGHRTWYRVVGDLERFLRVVEAFLERVEA